MEKKSLRETLISEVYQNKVIAIVRGVYGQPLAQLAQALYEGGVKMMEITFDQAHPENHSLTCRGIALLREQFGEKVRVGAGTVTTVELVRQAADAGAEYMISPDFCPEVIRETRELGLVSMPGALTPTEIRQAYDHGADFVKVFPAGCLGPEYIKAISAPLNHIPLLAVGGVSESNLAAFLACGCKGAGIGGNLVNKAWIQAEAWDKITAAARTISLAAQGKA